MKPIDILDNKHYIITNIANRMFNEETNPHNSAVENSLISNSSATDRYNILREAVVSLQLQHRREKDTIEVVKNRINELNFDAIEINCKLEEQTLLLENWTLGKNIVITEDRNEQISRSKEVIDNLKKSVTDLLIKKVNNIDNVEKVKNHFETIRTKYNSTEDKLREFTRDLINLDPNNN